MGPHFWGNFAKVCNVIKQVLFVGKKTNLFMQSFWLWYQTDETFESSKVNCSIYKSKLDYFNPSLHCTVEMRALKLFVIEHDNERRRKTSNEINLQSRCDSDNSQSFRLEITCKLKKSPTAWNHLVKKLENKVLKLRVQWAADIYGGIHTNVRM